MSKQLEQTPGRVFRDCDQCPEMVAIPVGSFRMGDLNGRGAVNERPVHEVRIAYNFAVGKYEVTFAEWDACRADGGCKGDNPEDMGWRRTGIECTAGLPATSAFGATSPMTTDPAATNAWAPMVTPHTIVALAPIVVPAATWVRRNSGPSVGRCVVIAAHAGRLRELAREGTVAYIRQIEPEDADAELAEFYDRVVELAGAVPNIVKLSSLKPAAAKAAQDLYQSVLYHDSGLTMADKETVAVVVSVINRCVYCYEHHGASLTELTGDEELTRAIITDHAGVALPGRTRALVDLAVKLTSEPEAMEPADVDRLREGGLSDEDIVDLVQLVAYFNYTTRLANALGVDPEPA